MIYIGYKKQKQNEKSQSVEENKNNNK